MIEQPSNPNPREQPDVINQPPPAEKPVQKPEVIPPSAPEPHPEPPPTVPDRVVR